MGRGRQVQWNATPPTRAELEATTREFFGPSATYEFGDQRVFVVLPMAFSDTRHPVSGDKREGTERYVSVWFFDAVVVETQYADRFTDAVADELAAVFSWYFNGTIQEGVSRKEYAKFRGETFWPTRGRALERAIEASLDDGLPRESVIAWAVKHGWAVEVETVHRTSYDILSRESCDDIVLMRECPVTFDEIESIAEPCDIKVSAALEEIMVPDR